GQGGQTGPPLRLLRRLGRPPLRLLAHQAHREPQGTHRQGRRPHPRDRHPKRPRNPLQVGPKPSQRTRLRHPPHVQRRRPHRLPPRHPLHPHSNGTLPTNNPTPQARHHLLTPQGASTKITSHPGADHPPNPVDCCSHQATAGRLSSVGRAIH